ncbi:MAG: nuclear transport factor 2 family protein [Planctomycetota bacterium]
MIPAPEPVARQLDAYNRQDVATFSAAYTDDVVLEDADKGVFVKGRPQLVERYAKLFQDHPENRARVLARSIVGPWVFEEEEVTRGGGTFRVLVVYKVRGELIERATFYRS